MGCKHLSDVRPLSILEKSTLTLIHKSQLCVIWGTLIAFLLCKVTLWFYYERPDAVNGVDSEQYMQMNERYCMYFIQFGVLARMFFLIPTNQRLIYVIFNVLPSFYHYLHF